ACGLACVEQRQERAPRIANDEWRIDAQLRDDVLEILDVRLPGDGGLTSSVVEPRLAAAALIVEEQLALGAVRGALEPQHLRQHVVVMGARAAVQEEQPFAAGGAVGAPVERCTGGLGKTGYARRRDGEGGARHARNNSRRRAARRNDRAGRSSYAPARS